MTIATLTPAEAQAQIAQGARLIDIRDADEYAREHIPDAELVPLATLTSGAPLNARAGETVIFHCQAGSRTQNNAIRLAAAAAPAQPCLLAGGIQAWKAAGLPVVEDSSQPLPLMRQVQIAAGVLILLGVLLGYTVNGGFFLLSGAVGAGLTFAGVTGFCGMARLLATMPWNRRQGLKRAPDKPGNAAEEQPFDDVIDRLIPFFQPLTNNTDLVNIAKRPVNPAGAIADIVGRRSGAHQMASQPVVNFLRPAVAHRPFNIAEQNQAILTTGIFRIVDIGLVKQHAFSIAPTVTLAIHLDKAAVIVRRCQAQMKA